MKLRIHINQHVIRRNAKARAEDPHHVMEPCITVKSYKDNTYGSSVEILGPSTVVYSPDKPLSCGAKVWIETESEVIVN